MIMEQAAKSGLPLPDSIQNAPSILPGLELYYLGFQDLMSSRQVGMGLGPVSWETIDRYCERKGLDEEQTEAMHFHVRALDAFYLKHLSKKK